MEEHTHKFSYTGAVSAYTPAGSGNQSAYAYTFNATTQGLVSGRITAEGVTRGKRKGVNYLIKVMY